MMTLTIPWALRALAHLGDDVGSTTVEDDLVRDHAMFAAATSVAANLPRPLSTHIAARVLAAPGATVALGSDPVAHALCVLAHSRRERVRMGLGDLDVVYLDSSGRADPEGDPTEEIDTYVCELGPEGEPLGEERARVTLDGVGGILLEGDEGAEAGVVECVLYRRDKRWELSVGGNGHEAFIARFNPDSTDVLRRDHKGIVPDRVIVTFTPGEAE